MKYLLCYAWTDVIEDNDGVETEEFDSFKDAVIQYTSMCEHYHSVTLSEINGNLGHIIRQYRRSDVGVFIL